MEKRAAKKAKKKGQRHEAKSGKGKPLLVLKRKKPGARGCLRYALRAYTDSQRRSGGGESKKPREKKRTSKKPRKEF